LITPPSTIFAGAFQPGSAEDFSTLLETEQVKIERIVSHGQASPPDFWYDQPDDEWVLLLRGAATLELEQTGIIELVTGSYLHLPKRLRHRVVSTSEDAVWLAVHIKEGAGNAAG
jgi:cupin 2 domain-containing protein